MLSSEGDGQSEEDNKEVCAHLMLKLQADSPNLLESDNHHLPRCKRFGMACSFHSLWYAFPPNKLFVFLTIVLVEDGTFPFYRTEDVEEERFVALTESIPLILKTIRRLLYVACTRAQCLLYLSHTEKRKIAGETKTQIMSPFLSAIKTEAQARTGSLLKA